MKEEILANLNNPLQLEKLYRADKSAFKRDFNTLYAGMHDNNLLGFWNARLNFSKDDISWGTRTELVFVIALALIAGLVAKLPAILSLNEERFYTQNAGFILFPFLAAFFAWKNKPATGKLLFLGAAILAGIVFINSIPHGLTNDIYFLSCIHLPLFLWSLLGFAFAGEAGNNTEKRLAYLRYNGDLIVITTLMLIAGGILTGITVGLFQLIGIRIEEFYFRNIVLFGLPAAPILGTYLTQTNPQLVGKVSPVIAKIFSPLVLVTLVVYLIAIVYSGKDPYNDREFLLVFNALLIGVMAIIFFSVAESSKGSSTGYERWVLLILSMVTITVNGIALSAILFRISSWGITPNRMAVLGGNLLILANLVLVTGQLLKAVRRKESLAGVGMIMGRYLPVYAAWTIVVTFLFPLFFGFR